MEFKDKGIVLDIKPFQERGMVVRVFSRNHGVVGGFLQRSRSIKSVLNAGSVLSFSWKARLQDQLGYLNIEEVDNIVGFVAFDAFKLDVLNALLSFARALFKDRQEYPLLHDGMLRVIDTLANKNQRKVILKEYLQFEMKLLEYLGYGFDWSRCYMSGEVVDLHYISPKTGNIVSKAVGAPYKERLFIYPKFLFEDDLEFSKDEVQDAFKLIGHFLEKRILQGKHKALLLHRQRLLNGNIF